MMSAPLLTAVIVFCATVLVVSPVGMRSRITSVASTASTAGPEHAASASSRRPRGPVAVVLQALGDRRRNVAVEAAEWVVWMRQLSALLSVGRGPGSAFEVAADSLAESSDPSATGVRIESVCRTVARATSVGRPPSVTLRTLAGHPSTGRPRLQRVETAVLLDLARCWEVSEHTGAPLAALLEGLAEATEADLDATAARETALAGSRATVKILTWLPVVALGLGVLIGADPLRTLFTTPWGVAAGCAGGLLTVIGRVWTGRMVRSAERVTDHAPDQGHGRTRNGHSPSGRGTRQPRRTQRAIREASA